jgi:CBS domain-containing protein
LTAGLIGARHDGRPRGPADHAHMKVEQLMTRDVVTVTPETSLKDVARLLAGRRISGVPVCAADGQVVGVVTEADILWKELGLEPGSGGMLERLFGRAYGIDERVGAACAAEAMTAPAITVPPGAAVVRAAELMIDKGVNRLPVVEHGRLVGIVARADLVRAFARSDAEIRREIGEDVLLRTLWIDPQTVSLAVDAGVVTVSGEVEDRATAELAEQWIRRVPGVAAVRSELRWRADRGSGASAAPHAGAWLPPF